jgi:dienelactone hydrolase
VAGEQQQLPPPPATCGNGVVDPGEDCDGATPVTCSGATMGSLPLGEAACVGCRVDSSGCYSAALPGAGGAPGTGGVINEPGPPPGAGGAPVVTPVPPGRRDPVIPPVTGQCPQFTNGTISFMGLGGIQIVAGPKAASPTAPLVFYWHGTGSFSGEFAIMASAVQRGVVAEGGVLVSFQGTSGGDLLSGTLIFGASDFNIADQLVACAVRDHNVDPRRIYATGCSAGGLFSAAMAAARSNYVAAAAPNSGGWVVPVAFQNDFTPALMTMHGAPGADVVVIDFSTSSATADRAFKARQGFVINCNTGGGHCGAGSLSGAVWDFFKAHPYGVEPLPWTGGLPAGFPNQCALY